MRKKTRKKVAFVLGGGGSRGAYEVGVWQALQELGVSIDIVTGTSVGGINGAMVALGDVDKTATLWKELETHMVFDVPEGIQPIEYAREIVFNHGAGTSGLKELLDRYVDEEAVRKSPVEYGLTVVSLPSFEAHYLFKEDIPKGQLVDYIVAGGSAFPAIHSYEIDGVDYIDGGYADEIPVDMAISKGATHIIAVNLKGLGKVNHKSINNAPNLILIEPKWDLGMLFIFDTENTRRILRLGYLDTMKAFNVIDGGYFAFARGSFDKTTTRMADFCGKVFNMDPLILYTKESFLERLTQILEDSQADLEEARNRYKDLLSSVVLAKDILMDIKKDIKSVANQKILTFLIAYNLKEKGAKSMFLSRTALKLLPEQILAARFLVKYSLI